MSKDQRRLQISAERVSNVSAAQLAKLKASMTEKVLKPLKDRAVAQREKVAKVRSRTVR